MCFSREHDRRPRKPLNKFAETSRFKYNRLGVSGLVQTIPSREWPAAVAGLYRSAAPAVVCAPRYAPLKAAALLGVNGLVWVRRSGERRYSG